MKDKDKQNNTIGQGSISASSSAGGEQVSSTAGAQASTSSKIRAGLLGLTPATIFKLTFFTSVVVAVAATIIYHTATDSIHVNVNKVETSSVLLSGADDIGGIESGGYKSVQYSVKNESTSPAYVFVRIKEATAGLYEVVSSSSEGAPDGWCRVSAAEGDDELIFAYGELGGLTPVSIGEEVVMSGRLHCLAGAEEYSTLTGDDLDLDVYGCLVYGTDSDGGSIGYDTSAGALWEKYIEFKD